jgi:molecular chaperone HscB
MDYFETFGLERRLGLDVSALQQRFYELSRRTHPDFHQAAPAAEQARVLEASALLNAAYRALRDPVARADYLVRLEEGRATREGDTDKPKAPATLLQEMFEIQEALADARGGALDDARRATLADERDRLHRRFRDVEARLGGELAAAWDAASPEARPRALAALKEALATRAYLRTVLEDLGEALDGDREAYVANRRD